MANRRFMPVWVLALSLASCNTSFESAPAGPIVDPGPFLGQWGPAPGSGGTDGLEVSAGPDGTPVAVYTHGDTGEALTETVRLVDVAGNTIASVQGEAGLWEHFKVDRVTDTLQLSLIDEDVVWADVEQGVVAGFLITTTHEPGEDRVRVSASDTELSDYFETNPDSFALPSLVWHKAGGSPSRADDSAPLALNWRLPDLILIGLVALAGLVWLWRKGGT